MIKKLLRGGSSILMAALLVVAFTAGGGTHAGGVDGYDPKTYGTSVPPGTNIERAQEIVDNDPAITAYKIYTIKLPNPVTGEAIACSYKLPMSVPTPTLKTHTWRGSRVSEKLAVVKLVANDRTHAVNFLVKWPTLEGYAITYVVMEPKTVTCYIYDADGNPQAATEKELKDLVNSHATMGERGEV